MNREFMVRENESSGPHRIIWRSGWSNPRRLVASDDCRWRPRRAKALVSDFRAAKPLLAHAPNANPVSNGPAAIVDEIESSFFRVDFDCPRFFVNKACGFRAERMLWIN
jgi:hypothetical protein